MSSIAVGDAPAVELIGITKRFPGVVANDAISLRVMPGEVLCLLGENGAGKSTLMNILSGLYQPDSGQIRIAGRDVRVDSPGAGRGLGIGMVYQHLSLIPTLTVLENLMLGSNPGLVLDEAGARARLGELAGTLGIQLDPDARAGSLALGQQQQVEIIKALWKGSRVLILDEPTSMLTPQGIAELEKVLVGLKESGLAIIFITHKLHEATAIGDRVVVLRAGRVVGSIEREVLGASTPDQLQRMIVRLMFGEQEEPAASIAELREEMGIEHVRRALSDEPWLELVDATAAGDEDQPGIDGISLSIRGGGDPRRRRHRWQWAARARGGDRRSAPAGVGTDPVARPGRRPPQRVRTAASWPPLRDRRPARRRGRRALPGRTEPRSSSASARRPSGGAARSIGRASTPPRARSSLSSTSGPRRSARRSASCPAATSRRRSWRASCHSSRRSSSSASPPTASTCGRSPRSASGSASWPTEACAILVISTDLDELIDLADRVAVMYAGRIAGIVEVGPGAETRIGELILAGSAA